PPRHSPPPPPPPPPLPPPTYSPLPSSLARPRPPGRSAAPAPTPAPPRSRPQAPPAVPDPRAVRRSAPRAPGVAPRAPRRRGGALGFGALLLEGAYISSKGCGGPQVACVTAAPLGELALVCALFTEVGAHSARRVLGALGTTQRAVFSEAHGWAKSNPALVKA